MGDEATKHTQPDSTPATAACSALDTGSSPVPWAIIELTAQEPGHSCTVLLGSAHSVLLLSHASPHPLLLPLPCLGQLSPSPGLQVLTHILRGAGSWLLSALGQECGEPRLSDNLPDLAALPQMHATDQADSSVQSEIHICKVPCTMLSKTLCPQLQCQGCPSLAPAGEVQWLQKGWQRQLIQGLGEAAR